LKILVHTKNNKAAMSQVLIFQSLIGARDLATHALIAAPIFFHDFSSSRTLSKIRIFASTHIHRARIIAAIPLNEKA